MSNKKFKLPANEQITINPYFDNDADSIFDKVLVGAKSLHKGLKNTTLASIGATIADFKHSKLETAIYNHKDYVLHGVMPKHWQANICDEQKFEPIQALYELFRLSIEPKNYRLQKYTDEQRYFILFILSGYSRFRIDHSWLGEFLPLDIDHVDDVYFTNADLSQLLGISTAFFERLKKNIPDWLTRDNVKTKIHDKNDDNFDKILNKAKAINPKNIHATTDEWLAGFNRPFSKDFFEEEPEVVPTKANMLMLCPELEGYASYRVYKGKLTTVYSIENAKKLLSVFAAVGLYQCSKK